MSTKSSFKVTEMRWLDTKAEVKHLGSRRLFGYVAHKESPPLICIKVSGPDDRGVQKDIVLDIASLVKEMKRLRVI